MWDGKLGGNLRWDTAMLVRSGRQRGFFLTRWKRQVDFYSNPRPRFSLGFWKTIPTDWKTRWRMEPWVCAPSLNPWRVIEHAALIEVSSLWLMLMDFTEWVSYWEPFQVSIAASVVAFTDYSFSHITARFILHSIKTAMLHRNTALTAPRNPKFWF